MSGIVQMFPAQRSSQNYLPQSSDRDVRLAIAVTTNTRIILRGKCAWASRKQRKQPSRDCNNGMTGRQNWRRTLLPLVAACTSFRGRIVRLTRARVVLESDTGQPAFNLVNCRFDYGPQWPA
jgi:hypothetical protein